MTTPESQKPTPTPGTPPPVPQTHDPSAGGPVVAIVLGVIIIVAAVVLVMSVGQNEVGGAAEAKPATGDKSPAAEPKSAVEPKAEGKKEQAPVAGEDNLAAHLKAAREYADKT